MTTSTNPKEIFWDFYNEKTENGKYELARADEYLIQHRLEANRRFQELTGDRMGQPLGVPLDFVTKMLLKDLIYS